MTTARPSEDETCRVSQIRRTGPRRCVRCALRRAEHVLAAGLLLALLCVVTPLAGWLYESFDRQGALRHARYVICLGGDPARVVEAARLLSEGWAEVLVVSNHGPAAEMMRDLAVDWGAPPNQVLVDDRAERTADHPDSVQKVTGLDPVRDRCIVVTSYIHMARSKACFERAGYRRVVMREPRWERAFRSPPSWKGRFLILPELIYEGAAWIEYWIRGYV